MGTARGHRAGLRHTSDSGFLRSVRDRVLENTGVAESETLLDVGAGDGLVAFGALELVARRAG